MIRSLALTHWLTGLRRRLTSVDEGNRDVVAEHLARSLDVTPGNELEESHVIVVRLPSAGRLVLRYMDEQHRCVEQAAYHLELTSKSCRLVDRQMELAVENRTDRRISGYAQPRLDQSGDIELCAVDGGSGLAEQVDLEQLSQPHYLDQLISRDLGDHGSAMWVETDEAFGGQIAQRLAYRGHAHAKLLSDLGLEQPGATWDLAAQDGVPQRLAGHLVRRARRRRNRAEVDS